MIETSVSLSYTLIWRRPHKIYLQMLDNTDAAGDDAAGGSKAGNEWIGLALRPHDKVAGLMRTVQGFTGERRV